MKKLCTFLLICLLCLGCVVPAVSDAGGPYFNELEAYVQRRDGIPLMDFSGRQIVTIPYGTKLTITGAYNEDGMTRYYTSYQDEYGYVTEDGLALDLSPVSPADFHALGREHHMVVSDPDGVTMYAGPGEFYAAVGKKLPDGAEIICTHSNIPKDYPYELPGWEYGTWNGQSGWIAVDWNHDELLNLVRWGEPRIGKRFTGTLTIMNPGVRLQASLKSSDKIGQEIPVGTTLKYEKYFGNNAYVTYGGKSGWLLMSSDMIVGQIGVLYAAVRSGAPLYRTAGDLSSETERMLPYGTIADVTATYEQAIWNSAKGYNDWRYWYRVKTDGGDAWACFDETEDYDFFAGEGVPYQVDAKDGVRLYAAPNKKDSAGTAAKGTVLLLTCAYYNGDETWYWMVADGLRGWYRGDPENAMKEASLIQAAPKSAPATTAAQTTVTPGVTTGAATSAAETAPGAEALTAQTAAGAAPTGAAAASDATTGVRLPAAQASPRVILFGSLAAAVILALVAAVTILLIKKRREST